MSPLSLDRVLERLLERPPRVLDGADLARAAVAAIFRDGDRGAELLFIRRASHPDDPWSGQIGFPGGRHEEGDPDLASTAAREAWEELGLDLRVPPARLVGPLDDLQARARLPIQPLAIRPVAFGWWGDPPTLAPAPEEVADAFWVPLATLTDPDRRRWYDAERAQVGLRFPAIDLGTDPPLWGLTHRMVFEILGRLDLVPDVDEATLPRPR